MARHAAADVRDRILAAAEERLWQYGFKKTTIDEIAVDAGIAKGTVYLHFESKEDIVLEIMAQFKQQSLQQQRLIAGNQSLTVRERLKQALALPPLRACQSLLKYPGSLDMIIAVRPRMREYMKKYWDEELEVLEEIVRDGIDRGELAPQNAAFTARALKRMTAGFFPPYPCQPDVAGIEDAIGEIVDMVVDGIGSHINSADARTRDQLFEEARERPQR